MQQLLPILAGTALALAAGTSQATVLTFDSSPTSTALATYGDRVSQFGSEYGSAGGATPNVVVDFVIDSGRAPYVYAGGYGTLQYALGHANYNEPGSVLLTPDAGYDVVLEGFDLAGWSVASYPDSRVRIVDSAGTAYLDTGSFTFVPTLVLHYASTPIRSSLPLRIVVQDFGDLGIDNIAFSQVSNVPEPGIWALLAAGLGVVGALSRRRAARAR